jgi:hypothetical protein
MTMIINIIIITIIIIVVVICVKNLLFKCTFRSYMLNFSHTTSQLHIIVIYITAYISHIICIYTYSINLRTILHVLNLKWLITY